MNGGLIILLIVIGAQFYCGMASVTANSRMIYAFSRDGAIPGSSFWHRINPADPDANQLDLARRRRSVPARPAVPLQRGRLLRGHLDRRHRPVHRLHHAGLPATSGRIGLRGRAVEPRPLEPADRHGRDAWVVLIAILFMLPQVVPVRADTFNYAPVAVGVVVLIAGGWWMLSARKLVQGAQGPGNPGRAGRDRARARARRELTAAPTASTRMGTPGHRPGVSIPGPRADRFAGP